MRQAWMLDRPAVRVWNTRDACVTVGRVQTCSEKCGDGDRIGSVRLAASSLRVAPCGSAAPPPVVGVAATLFDFVYRKNLKHRYLVQLFLFHWNGSAYERAPIARHEVPAAEGLEVAFVADAVLIKPLRAAEMSKASLTVTMFDYRGSRCDIVLPDIVLRTKVIPTMRLSHTQARILMFSVGCTCPMCVQCIREFSSSGPDVCVPDVGDDDNDDALLDCARALCGVPGGRSALRTFLRNFSAAAAAPTPTPGPTPTPTPGPTPGTVDATAPDDLFAAREPTSADLERELGAWWDLDSAP
jgi:hypothetical protein